jgi:hypothetical protein
MFKAILGVGGPFRGGHFGSRNPGASGFTGQ